jgi:hypothetical protein
VVVFFLVLVNIIFMKPIYIILIAVAGFIAYKLYAAKVMAPAASATSPTVVSDTLYQAAVNAGAGSPQPAGSHVVGYAAPPGYSGPVNGPFSWAGTGEPTMGYSTPGFPVYGF